MKGRLIEFMGEQRPCYWPLASLEEYAELVGVPFEACFTKIFPTKLLYVGLKWGAIAQNKDFGLTLQQVQLAFDESGISVEELSEWFSGDLQPIIEAKKKKEAEAKKKR